LFDNLHTDPASKICTSIEEGKFYTVSTSATASNTGPYTIGSTISLSSSGGNSYSWSGPSSFSSSLQNPTISSATTAMGGNYTVTAFGDVGCPDQASTSVTVTAAPEIKISANGFEIIDGDNSPSSSDNTYFGIVSEPGGTRSLTFLIENTGSADLTLSGSSKVAISGTNASDFTVSSQPSGTITSSSSTSFILEFAPSGKGLRTATITIESNDADEDPYTFDISGIGHVEFNNNIEFTWIGGSNSTSSQYGVYGTKGVSASTNMPGSRYGAASWTDRNGDFWVFGGHGYASGGLGDLNDLWKWDGSDWTWIGGSSSINQFGNYGTKGVSSSSNWPGSRQGVAYALDNEGNRFYLRFLF